jgi:hypothetical protein
MKLVGKNRKYFFRKIFTFLTIFGSFPAKNGQKRPETAEDDEIIGKKSKIIFRKFFTFLTIFGSFSGKKWSKWSKYGQKQ